MITIMFFSYLKYLYILNDLPFDGLIGASIMGILAEITAFVFILATWVAYGKARSGK